MPSLPLRLQSRLPRPLIHHHAAFHTTASNLSHLDVPSLLATPTWSLTTLLPSPSSPQSPTISSLQLHHLLRLSALPPPSSASEEQTMLDQLHAHLHFVAEIRKVSTTNISPLQSLRDETSAGEKEQGVRLEDLEDVFAREEVRGSYYTRIRRGQQGDGVEGEGQETWDVLGAARKKVGRYFVVEGGKEG